MSGRWTWLVVAAALVVLVLLWVERRDSGGVPSAEPRADDGSAGAVWVGAPGEERALVLPPMPLAGSGAREPGPAADPAANLRVRVVAREGRAPLPGAHAVLLLETQRSLEEGWASLAQALGPVAVADAEGRATLAWGAVSGTRRVLAWGAGHGAVDVRLDAWIDQELTLALPTGLAIEGVVVDATGTPQPGLPVCAVAARKPLAPTPSSAAPDAPRSPALSEPGAERAEAVSDADGRFRLTGLSAGFYWLAVEDPTFRPRSDLPASTAAPWPGAAGVLVETGAKDARLVVVRVGVVVLDLVDAATEAPVGGAWATVDLLVPGEARMTTLTTYAPPPRPAGDGTPDPRQGAPSWGSRTRFVATVPWDGRTLEIGVAVRADGYQPLAAQVHVRPPGPPPAAGDVLRLERALPAGGCRLVLDCARDTGPFERPATRLLTLCFPSDGRRVHLRGVPERGASGDDDRWRFDDLPAGEVTAEVYDGLSLSAPLSLTLTPGVAVEARVAFDPLSGAVFVLRDEKGRRVYDADRLLVAPAGRERALPDRAAVTRLVPGREVPLPLAPGEYRFAVSKAGVGYDAGTFRVAAGGTVRVEARLGSLRRFVEDRVRRPR